jgi:NAD+ synthase (glutamine-hydrolysing)
LNKPGTLTLALAQVDLLVGDVQGNLALVQRESQRARDELAADLVMFPELTLCGYPPEDLLFHRGLRAQIEHALTQLSSSAHGIDVVVGFPEYDGTQIYNSAAVVREGRLEALRRKGCLPNYRVFDEKRYFTAGTEPAVFECRGFRLGLLVCEDAWEPEPARRACAAGAELLIVVNASPFEMRKQREREQVLCARATECRVPIAYVNLVGGQDELVFDGNSFVMDAAGTVVMPSAHSGVNFFRCSRNSWKPDRQRTPPTSNSPSSAMSADTASV